MFVVINGVYDEMDGTMCVVINGVCDEREGKHFKTKYGPVVILLKFLRHDLFLKSRYN